MKPVLTTNQDERNQIPLADGCLYYFPNALAEIAKLSRIANEQHNPGEPMHWSRNKSTDHANKILKHLIDAGTFDSDNTRHSTKVAWRAMAQLEDELIAAGATPGRNAISEPKCRIVIEPKFKPYSDESPPQEGDRVRVLWSSDSFYGVRRGEVGTVREDSTIPWIHMDAPTAYPSAVASLGIPAGYANCCPWHCLERIA